MNKKRVKVTPFDAQPCYLTDADRDFSQALAGMQLAAEALRRCPAC